MGGGEGVAQAILEPMLGYHPWAVGDLTEGKTFPGTVPGGQFDWGGRLPNSNGGAQWFPQNGWKSFIERIGIRELDCETDGSSRYESRA